MRTIPLFAIAAIAAAPLPALATDGNTGNLAMSACTNLKAGLPLERAVAVAMNTGTYFTNELRKAGATDQEIARMVVVAMRDWCGGQLQSTAQKKPKLSAAEVKAAQLRSKNEELAKQRLACSDLLSQTPQAERLNVLMKNCYQA